MWQKVRFWPVSNEFAGSNLKNAAITIKSLKKELVELPLVFRIYHFAQFFLSDFRKLNLDN